MQEYSIREVLHESGNTRVLRATGPAGEAVVIKECRLVDERDAIRLRREYRTTTRLSGPGVVPALKFEEDAVSCRIVFADTGSISLERYRQTILDIPSYLALAIRISNMLQRIHEQGVLHQDIKPANILVSTSDPADVHIIDFGLAMEHASGFRRTSHSPLQGSLLYMAPEQTGRLNRVIDVRADLYALGITLYEVLTGQHPLPIAHDPLEMLHRQIAMPARPPGEHRADVPDALSAVILKLLAKAPEDRYRSAEGLRLDLEYLHARDGAHDEPGDFRPGLRELQSNFRMPSGLFGQTHNRARLAELWTASCAGANHFVLLEGEAGSGKSSLAYDLQLEVVISHGLFLAGKVDQSRRDIPYAVFLDAFAYLQGLLGKGLSEYADVQEFLDGPGRVLLELLRRDDGESVLSAAVQLDDREQIFHNTFRRFIALLARADRPVLLFLDDLHWCDDASLRLIETVRSDASIQHLMILGTYRPGELGMTADHPVTRWQKTANEQLRMRALDQGDVVAMLGQSLHMSAEHAAQLAQTLVSRAQGNPLFVREYLQAIHQSGQLEMDESGRWQFDPERLPGPALPEQVAEVISHKVALLDDEVRGLLAIAACMGNQFPVALLARVQHCVSQDECRLMLGPALLAGLIAPLDASGAEPGAAAFQQYCFLHDRIQEAARETLSAFEQQQVHARIAAAYLRLVDADAMRAVDAALREEVFAVANHIQLAGEQWPPATDSGEASRLPATSIVLLCAGRRAMAAMARTAGVGYLRDALRRLGPDAWRESYGLCLALHLETARGELLSGEQERAETLVQTIRREAREPLDQLAAVEVQIGLLAARGAISEIVQVGLQLLSDLGMRLPRKPGRVRTLLRFARAEIKTRLRGIDSILHRAATTDPLVRACARLLDLILSSAYRSDPNQFLVISSASMELAYRHGRTPSTALALAGQGMIFAGLNLYASAARYGEVARRLLEQQSDHPSRVIFCVEAVASHWVQPLEQSAAALVAGASEGWTEGDIEYYGYCRLYSSVHRFHSSGVLSELKAEFLDQLHSAQSLRNENALVLVQIYLQLVCNLSDAGGSARSLDGEYYTSTAGLEKLRGLNYRGAILVHYGAEGLLHYLFGRDVQAVQSFEQAREHEYFAQGMFFTPALDYYQALSELRLARAELPQSERARRAAHKMRRRTAISRAKRLLRRFRRWERSSPSVAASRRMLLEAELNFTRGRTNRAVELYNNAIVAANEHSSHLELGLANELAGHCQLATGHAPIARNYFQDAHRAYARWGAHAKLRALRSEHPFLDEPGEGQQMAARARLASTLQRESGSELFDLATIQKASALLFGGESSHAIGQEFLELIVTNSGASHGALLMRGDDGLELVAAHSPSPGFADEIAREPIAEAERRRVPVTIADAQAAAPAQRARSILAVPLVQSGELNGMLYLENRLVADAFGQLNLSLLQMLGAQICLSHENADRYAAIRSELEADSERIIQLKLARGRMDPHFLYNSLNMVQAMMRTRPADANQALQIVARLYESLSDIAGEDQVPLRQEWRFLSEYLALMKLRHASSLELDLQSPADLPDVSVPGMILQPLVENAFKHAFAGVGSGKLQLRVRLECGPDAIEFECVDNGQGPGPNPLSGTTLGSIQDRVQHARPGSRLSILHAIPTGGTRVALRIAIS